MTDKKSIDFQIKDHVKDINSSSTSWQKFYPEGRTCRLYILGRSLTDRRQARVTHNYVHWGCKSTLKTSINGPLFGTTQLFRNVCTGMCEQKMLQYDISSIMQCFNSDSPKVHSGYYFYKKNNDRKLMYKGKLIPQVTRAKTCVRHQREYSGDFQREIHFWSRGLKKLTYCNVLPK
jgi:hypothetical protein